MIYKILYNHIINTKKQYYKILWKNKKGSDKKCHM